jgi:hypothetical protein
LPYCPSRAGGNPENEEIRLFTKPSTIHMEIIEMNTTSKNRVVNLSRLVAVMIAITIGFTLMPGFVPKVHSHDGAAFLGGMVAGHLIGGAVRRSERRTEAAEYQAYSQPRTVQQAAPAPAPAPAPAAKPTAKQRLDELDKLAAGGYITPE